MYVVLFPHKDCTKSDANIQFNANRDDLLKLADDYGFSLFSINTEVPEFPSIIEQQELVLNHQSPSYPDLFYATTVSTENVFNDGWADQAIAKIKQDLDKGASGVKFWKNIGMSIQRPDGSFLMQDHEQLKPVSDFF